VHWYVKSTQLAAAPVVVLMHENTGAVVLFVTAIYSGVPVAFGVAVQKDLLGHVPENVVVTEVFEPMLEIEPPQLVDPVARVPWLTDGYPPRQVGPVDGSRTSQAPAEKPIAVAVCTPLPAVVRLMFVAASALACDVASWMWSASILMT
jgi:hypothetical protein